MGWRAIRVSFDRPALLREQLRALIRAAAGQELSLMFPMIAEVNEFDYARRLLDKELDREKRLGGTSPESIRVGAMLEVPALLFQLQALFSRVDFVSVGTNDLIQFLFASDRANYRISERYDVLSPILLSLLKTVVQQGKAANVPVNLCGEIASHPLDVMALLGIGFRNISVSPPAVGPIKETVRSLRISSLEKFTNSLCTSSQRNVRENLKAYAKDHGIAV
jgi:phosphotransferase system enzyme I (PtsP)